MSRTVNWSTVHAYIAAVLTRVGTWPMAGTQEWDELPDGDSRRIAALFDAAQHWALYIENNQTAQAQASKAVAASADWPAVAREVARLADARRSGARIERQAL